MLLNASRFPGTAAYLRQLPAGLESYPACRVRALVFTPNAKLFPQLAQEAPSGPVRELLRGELAMDDWLPEVAGQTANLMMRDACMRSDAEYVDWVYKTSIDSFD